MGSSDPPALQPAVSDLRDRFVAYVKRHFEKSEECFAPELSGAYAADIDTIRRSVHQSTLSARDELLYYHNRGHEAQAQILAQHVGRLQKWIAADAIFPASEFRKMAARNAVSGDPLNWAYGQIRSALYEFLGMPKGNRLGYWLDRVCDGRPAVNSDLFATPHEWVKAQLCRQASALPGYPAFVAVYLYGKPPEWLPAHLLPPRPQNENSREDWPRLDKKMSEEVLGKFVHNFWEDLDAKIIENLRNIRISLAQLPAEIIPAPVPAGPPAAAALSPQAAPSGEAKQVSLTPFEEFAGELYEAELQRSVNGVAKRRTVSKDALLLIADKLDKSPFIPPLKYLEKLHRAAVSAYNQKVGCDKALTTWRKLASNPIYQEGMRRRLFHAAQKLR